MKSRWSEEGAHDARSCWAAAQGGDFALRLYTARLLGEDPQLVLHGGGNCSLKQPIQNILGEPVEAIYVKASGFDLRTIEPPGFPAMDLAYLRRLRALASLTDEEMVNQIRTHLFDAAAPTPSIETLLHAFLPHRYIDHSHADAVIAIGNHSDGEALIREAVGGAAAVVPYVRPGFDLAKAVIEAYEANPRIEGAVLLQHGLITFGDDARESYERHIRIVDACERYTETKGRPLRLTAGFRGQESPDVLAVKAAPMLRGAIAWPSGDEDRPWRRSILERRSSDRLLELINSAQAARLAASGPLTADHLIHTKSHPLHVADPSWSDSETLRSQIREAVEGYRRAHEAYRTAHGGTADGADPSPRVVLLPGAGLFAWGPTKRAARITADIAEQALFTKQRAESLGAFVSLAPEHLYDMEYRGLQQVKLAPDRDRPLERQVVVISGGAGAIGSAIAEQCAAAGAHVSVADLDEQRLAGVVRRLEERFGVGVAVGVVMNVTDEASVRSGFETVVRTFGGVDVIVPNAGVAHVSPIDEMEVKDFRRVMEVNAVGYLLFMREGIRVLKRQGLGGNIVVSASKNVFAPGKDFGAYSASKAAGHQLGKVAALELAPLGIRVNMINADAVFGDEETPSGLWATVGPQRAKSRDMKESDLPEYYRARNLLKARVLGRHVGRAVVFFAGNSTPTTGATLPVDGGLLEAFPR